MHQVSVSVISGDQSTRSGSDPVMSVFSVPTCGIARNEQLTEMCKYASRRQSVSVMLLHVQTREERVKVR